MDAQTMLNILKERSDEQTKKTFLRHGAPEAVFGVKISELNKIIKEYKLRNNTEFGLQLYNTGNADAMYLAGLIVKQTEMTCEHLQHWVEKSKWHMTSESTVAQVAADSGHGFELALQWIQSDQESIASAGWSTLSNVVLVAENEQLNISKLQELLQYVETNLHSSSNRVRYAMNGFVISVGVSVLELSGDAINIAKRLGEINVEMGNTTCKVPDAATYIEQSLSKKPNGVKKKQARC